LRSCCLRNGCKPTSQDPFNLDGCTTDSCVGECRRRYPGACRAEGQPDVSIGICASSGGNRFASQSKTNMIF